MTLVSTSAKSAGGGASLWTLIQTITRATDGTIDFTGIPPDYSDLLIVGNVRGAAANQEDALLCQFNGDTTTNYQYQTLQGSAASTAAQSAVANANVALASNMAANTATANRFTIVEIRIIGYKATTWQKTVSCVMAGMDSGITSGNKVALQGGTWLSTAAVNRVLLFGLTAANLLTGSSLRLYGRT